ncbi:MAG TPA: hypothetical protein VFA58_00805, partial [Chthoniobacterales bacterium]|nr:hypothetical protein [Chthoniobacterales bacterium]
MTQATSGEPSQFPVELTFHDDLPFFLKSKKSRIERHLGERTSVKDVIEACGVPHTEVDAILIDGRPEGFGLVLDRPCKIEVYGVSDNPTTLLQEKRLQVRAIRTFVADGHLGKLV